MLSKDSTLTIEGLAFEIYGTSEDLARQASSTLLAVFTFAMAIGVTIGGAVFDYAGWQGMSVFHIGCVTSLLLLFGTQPACLKSFREFRNSKAEAKVGAVDESKAKECTSVVPVPVAAGAAAVADDLQVIDMEAALPGQLSEDVQEPTESTQAMNLPKRSGEQTSG